MKSNYNIKDRGTAYHFLKSDFISAYNNNGNDIELAITVVARLRGVETSHVKSVLSSYISKLKKDENTEKSRI